VSRQHPVRSRNATITINGVSINTVSINGVSIATDRWGGPWSAQDRAVARSVGGQLMQLGYNLHGPGPGHNPVLGAQLVEIGCELVDRERVAHAVAQLRAVRATLPATHAQVTRLHALMVELEATPVIVVPHYEVDKKFERGYLPMIKMTILTRLSGIEHNYALQAWLTDDRRELHATWRDATLRIAEAWTMRIERRVVLAPPPPHIAQLLGLAQ
jgi:hypothetical protein